jgi:hypothetical protein
MSTQGNGAEKWTACEHGVIADRIKSHGNFYVCAAIDPDNADQKNAMKQIAAVPELLEVAQIAASSIQVDRVALMDAARAAIAKAKGNP